MKKILKNYQVCLKDMGYERTENKEEASIIIFNTCCVRENAENKVYGNLRSI